MLVLFKASVFIMYQTLKAAFSFSILRYLLKKVCQPGILAYLMNIFPNNHLGLKYKGWLGRRIKEIRKVTQRVRVLLCNNQCLLFNPRHPQEKKKKQKRNKMKNPIRADGVSKAALQGGGSQIPRACWTASGLGGPESQGST